MPINHAADARARSLQLRPTKRPSAASRFFVIGPRKTDIEIVTSQRIVTCLDARKTGKRLKPC
jgi:hypothetical protein